MPGRESNPPTSDHKVRHPTDSATKPPLLTAREKEIKQKSKQLKPHYYYGHSLKFITSTALAKMYHKHKPAGFALAATDFCII